MHFETCILSHVHPCECYNPVVSFSSWENPVLASASSLIVGSPGNKDAPPAGAQLGTPKIRENNMQTQHCMCVCVYVSSLFFFVCPIPSLCVCVRVMPRMENIRWVGTQMTRCFSKGRSKIAASWQPGHGIRSRSLHSLQLA